MKRLLLFLLLVSNLSFAQFFTNSENDEEGNYPQQPEPQRGVDVDPESPPDEDAPIDNYLIYLTILGILIGGIKFSSKTKMRV